MSHCFPLLISFLNLTSDPGLDDMQSWYSDSLVKVSITGGNVSLLLRFLQFSFLFGSRYIIYVLKTSQISQKFSELSPSRLQPTYIVIIYFRKLNFSVCSFFLLYKSKLAY